MKTINILGISGSLRKDSYNTKLIHVAQHIAPEYINFNTFSLIDIPVFNEDLKINGDPEPVQKFKRAIQESDALLISTPEYNSSISGVLKNALDWASVSPGIDTLNRKPVGIMGGGGVMGTGRAQLHLRQVLSILNVHVLGSPLVHFHKVWELFDKEGNLNDESAKDRILKLLDALYQFTLKLK